MQYELKLIGVTHIYSSNHHCNRIILAWVAGTLGTQQEYTLNGTPVHQNPDYGPTTAFHLTQKLQNICLPVEHTSRIWSPEIGHEIQIPSTYPVLPGSQICVVRFNTQNMHIKQMHHCRHNAFSVAGIKKQMLQPSGVYRHESFSAPYILPLEI